MDRSDPLAFCTVCIHAYRLETKLVTVTVTAAIMKYATSESFYWCMQLLNEVFSL